MTSKTVLAVAFVTASSSMQLCSGFMQTPPTHTNKQFLETLSPTRPATLRHTSSFDNEVNEMFKQYDTDGNGQIDKEEFREVVKKMKSSSRRREIISVAAASFGSLVSHSLY